MFNKVFFFRIWCRLYCGKVYYKRAGHRWQYGARAFHARYLRLQIPSQNT